MDEEIELLNLFIKTCQTVRSARNPRNRVALAVPAAQWEIKFNARRAELEAAKLKKLEAAK